MGVECVPDWLHVEYGTGRISLLQVWRQARHDMGVLRMVAFHCAHAMGGALVVSRIDCLPSASRNGRGMLAILYFVIL